MPDNPLTAFLTELSDPRMIALAIIAAVAGVVRGFSGFGAALIYVPLASAVYDPVVAAATIFVIDFVAATPFAVRAIPQADWRDVLPLVVGVSATVPLGAALLRTLDPITMRWIISATVFGGLLLLASGWRYHGRPRLPITLGVGAVAGFFGGAAQLSGPPVVVYWLGGAISAATVRANLLVFFALASVVSGLTYFANGLFTFRVLAVSLVAGPVFGLAMIAGARAFHSATDATYRRVAYVIIAFAALASLPVARPAVPLSVLTTVGAATLPPTLHHQGGGRASRFPRELTNRDATSPLEGEVGSDRTVRAG